MDCASLRDLLSDDLDGRLDPQQRAAVNEHLAGCPACSAYRGGLVELHRRVRLRPAEPVPDLTGAILARAHPPQVGRGDWIRLALCAVAITQLIMAVPALVLGDDTGATTHVARHIGSLLVALAIGLLYAALRPVRAFGLLPIAASLAGCLLVTGVLDMASGRAAAAGEAHHVLDLAGLVLLWLLAGSPLPAVHRRRFARSAIEGGT